MFGTSKPGPSTNFGFTLVEILVAMAIIALVATVVVPNLKRPATAQGRQQFVRNLNALCAFAWQNSLVTGKVHKIDFDFQRSQVAAQIATDRKDDKGEAVYMPLKGAYLKSSFAIPKNLEFKNFVVEGFDEMSRFVGGRTTGVYFFIRPGSFPQTVTINLVDTKDVLGRNKPRPMGLVLNPFTAQFKEYDTFQK